MVWSHVAMCPGWDNDQDQGRDTFIQVQQRNAFTHAQQVAQNHHTDSDFLNDEANNEEFFLLKVDN